jgi:glucose-6-phosphate 1-dehydrogenase
MEAPVSDALVFFGITGDLAFKKIFPALQAMVRQRGEREGAFVDVIGVASAKWTLELLVSDQNADEMDSYERLLGDAAHGEATLFAREDAVEAAWRVVDPVLGDATPVHEYEPSTWGPAEAGALIAERHAWHNPISLEAA